MKTEHIQKQLDFFVRDKAHHAYRKPAGDAHALAAELAAQGLDDMQRSVARLRYVLAQETPVVFPDERIKMETPGCSVAMRVMDLVSPVGKGQRDCGSIRPAEKGGTGDCQSRRADSGRRRSHRRCGICG